MNASLNSIVRYDMIDCRTLFPLLSKNLLDVLQRLAPEDWLRPTRCRLWNVKDVAAHLLQTALGRLSRHRDGYSFLRGATSGLPNFEQIVQIINQANAHWVNAWQGVSPRIIVHFLQDVEAQLNEWLGQLPLLEKAPIGVAWAGEAESLNWFDIAREYTERWHHQQHIREAVGAPLLLNRELYHPVLDTFMLALPFTFRNIPAEAGTILAVKVSGDAGGSWFLGTVAGTWQLLPAAIPASSVTSAIEIPDTLAWKIFTKAARADETAGRIKLSGNTALAQQVLQMVSVMA